MNPLAELSTRAIIIVCHQGLQLLDYVVITSAKGAEKGRKYTKNNKSGKTYNL
jgi:hypothetical protein